MSDKQFIVLALIILVNFTGIMFYVRSVEWRITEKIDQVIDMLLESENETTEQGE